MSTVLHPAGPEPAQTYWMRRLALIGIAIVVLAVAGALIANGTSSGSAVQANPSPPPPAAPTAVTGTPTATPSPTPSPTPSAGARASATPAAASPAGKPSASASAAKPTPTAAPKPVACAANALRTTLTGAQRLQVKKRTTFTLSLINGSGQTCTATVTRGNFELQIYSGSDRIWSTKDCASIVRPRTRTLKAEQAMEWKLTWNGLRSRAGCKSRSEIPRSGTYYATAQLTGAEPVRLLMMLRG